MRLVIFAVAVAACGRGTRTQQLVATLRSDTIQVATYRPPDSPFATLDRRVVIVAPESAKQLSTLGDPAVLDELVPLLDDPERAWAAHVLLAALTRNDEKTVDVYARQPAEWWKVFGPSARRSWQAFLDEHRGHLTWDAELGAFTARAPRP